MRPLVTGGARFTGLNYIRFVLKKHPDHEVTNFDELTSAGNLESLTDVAEDPRCSFVRGDTYDTAVVG